MSEHERESWTVTDDGRVRRRVKRRSSKHLSFAPVPGLALAWTIVLVVRGLVIAGSYSLWQHRYGYHWPPDAHFVMFVPSSVACALVASAIHPKRALLVALVPLILPPDWFTPLGILVAWTMQAARTRTRQTLVAATAVVVAVALCAPSL